MTEKDFIETYRKRYRMMTEFDNYGNLIKGTEFIYCANGKIKIYHYNKKYCQIVIIGRQIKAVLEYLGDKVEYSTDDSGVEGWMLVSWKYLDEIIDWFSPKNSSNASVQSIRNLNYWLRGNRHIHSKYQDMLTQRIEDNRERLNKNKELNESGDVDE